MATNKTFLPSKDSPDYSIIVREYSTASSEKLDAWAKHYGYANRNSLKTAVIGAWGLRRQHTAPSLSKTIPEPQILIPPIKIKQYKPSKTKDPETQVLLIGDWHLGEITPSYNIEVAKKRLDTLFNSLMVITEVHRKSIAINDIVVIALGDMVHGENPHQGAKIEQVQMGAVNQIYEVALPELLSLLCSLKENFRSVKLYGIWGNHGRYGLEAPRTSNWDNALYKSLAKASLPHGIEVFPPSDFCQIVNINGFKFFCYHGDQINLSSGIPYFAQRRKITSWYITYGGFAYACQGHFHEDDFFTVSSETTLFANGALVSHDPFPLEKLGLSTIPIQRTFGVHEKIGVSWTNRIIVDWNFLPRKSNEKTTN